jgi:hypothetical protein
MLTSGVVFIKLVELKCTHVVFQSKLVTSASVISTVTTIQKPNRQ